MRIANEKKNSFSNLYFWITLGRVGLGGDVVEQIQEKFEEFRISRRIISAGSAD